jgi:hypothetical protein
MKIHYIWTASLIAGLYAIAAPTPVAATNYNMTVQSVPEAGSKCVSLPNGPSEQGMRILIWDCNGFLGQTLVYNDQTQELKFGTNCVGVIGDGNAQDAVGVGTCNGVVTQRWSMVPIKDNYQIIGVNNLCLDIADAVIANGTPLDLLPCAPDKAPELWVLYQASDPSTQTASNQTNPAGGAGAGSQSGGAGAGSQSGGAPDPKTSAGSSNPGSASGPSGGGGGPSGGGSGPGGGSSGPGGGGLGPLGGASTPAGGPSLPGPIVILLGAINPPFDPGTNPFAPPMDPGTTTMDPGTTTDPGNMTPASGNGPLTQQVCGLGADGQLVTMNMSLPPINPNRTPDTGQYCMSGGTLDGQCGTITLDPIAQTMQLCMHGQCTSPLPVNAGNTIPASYNPTFLGVPPSSPTVPCPGTTTASTDPLGGLGPPPMDVAYPMRAGKPQYSSLPKITTIAGLGPPPVGGNPGNTAGLGPPPNPGGTTTALGPPGNICHLPPPMPPTGNMCNPQTPASNMPMNPAGTTTKAGNPGATTQPKPANTCQPKPASNACATPVSPKPNGGPLKLKPNTQTASAGQPCNQKNQSAPVQACESKPPFLPWGGTGSAMITVSGGKPCGVGWHDTPGGPGGVTVLDSMTVSSQPSHGSAASQGHSVIFTPAPGYKGPDSFTLSMKEHNGGRSATLTVKVSVTIQ